MSKTNIKWCINCFNTLATHFYIPRGDDLPVGRCGYHHFDGKFIGHEHFREATFKDLKDLLALLD